MRRPRPLNGVDSSRGGGGIKQGNTGGLDLNSPDRTQMQGCGGVLKGPERFLILDIAVSYEGLAGAVRVTAR